MECVDFSDVRNKYFVVSSAKDLFEMSKHRTSLILLENIVFYIISCILSYIVSYMIYDISY